MREKGRKEVEGDEKKKEEEEEKCHKEVLT